SLHKLGLRTLADLALHFPRRHEDRRHFAPFPDAPAAQPVLLCGTVVKAGHLPYGGWRRGYEATIEETGGGALARRVSCRWFNMPYVGKLIATGMRMVAYGRVKARGKRLFLDFPEFEMIEDEGDALIHLHRITPIHPGGEGLTPRRLREWIFQALHTADLTRIPSLLPGAEADPARAAALRAIHFPESFDDLEAARRLLVSEEFFAMQALIASRRARVDALPGRPKASPGALLDRLRAALPFALTGAQRRAIAQIRADMASDRRMNRLLQGDVGSGKTLVALSAALLAIEAGFQAVVMAPTQLLAEQHYANFTRLLGPLGVRVALRTGARRTDANLELWAGEGAPQLLVGTQALLYEPDELRNPGLIVIDEQHKFGVLQRARLILRADAPDVLVMTATPIPRTLAQTAYGDLDITVIDELPANRGRIITGIRDPAKLPQAALFLRKQIEAGRQAYIVYPLVEESEKLEAKAAAAEFEKWRGLLAPHACGLLHGRLKPDEKDAAMRAFASGETKALVATTVIEVGIDVPNASVLLVENAERFGLAQLHQLRGRIGRDAHTSYCILMPGEDTPETREKLAVLERTRDGFEVAEADLRLRGPGDMLGTAQTGLPPLRLGDLARDAALLDEARQRATAIFRADPQLDCPEHAALKSWLALQDATALEG
ncbi:MAG: ATP-dependent DNA helicase RecG, partial [Terrimicrobiaceae bacterium]|nr:ATP-dependent DNA helicase RecG [Terrimicrobiaceae bacterium]